MKFLDRDAALTAKQKAQRNTDVSKGARQIVCYDCGSRDYRPAAEFIVDALGAFEDAVLIYELAISGDGWSESNELDKRWQRYRAWRADQGEHRRLFEAPGHVFEFDEQGALAAALVFALEIGWDAWLSATPGRTLMFLSHDDRLEVYLCADHRKLAKQLMKLGYWHA